MDMKINANDLPLKANFFRLSGAQRLLFSSGTQLRILTAILLCLFVTILPLMIPFGSFAFVPVTIFVTFPMIFGLVYMGEKVNNGEGLSVRDVFYAFSARRYWYSIRSVFVWLILLLVPISLLLCSIVGVWILHLVCVKDPELGAYSIFTFLFSFLLTIVISGILLLAVQPAYLFLTIRMREERIHVLRVISLLFQILKGNGFHLWVLQLKYALLIFLSVVSVCTLFPIYTIPLILVAAPYHLNELIEGNNYFLNELTITQ